MEKKNKKTLMLIIVSLVTLALGAIAVVTSLRLREYSEVAVAPTAPVSEPEAALLNNGCSESYSVDQSVCNGWCNDDDDCGLIEIEDASPSAVPLDCLIAEGETAGICRNPDDMTDDDCLPEETKTSCNQACISDDECVGDLVCDDDSGTCRKNECLDETDCSCPEDEEEKVCNEACDTDDDCKGDLVCDQPTKSCRNEDCTGEQDCECDVPTTPTPTPTSTPTASATPTPSSTPLPSATPEPSLPEAGSIVPTSTLLMSGGMLLVFGAMSLLLLL